MADYEDEQPQELSIDSDKITEDVNALLKARLQTERWNAKKVDGWCKDITEATLKALAEMKKPFKFVVTTVIMQRNGAGLSAGFIALWDNTRDGTVAVPLDTEHLYALVTVYFLKLD